MAYQGLSESKALELRRAFGENVIAQKQGIPLFSILFSQFKSPLIYILVVIGFISLFFREYFDLILIWSVIVLNTTMGFFQEYHVEKTLASLRKILKPKAVVIREGRRKQVLVKELVRGDLVLLGAGDRVPADGEIIEGTNLLINEAILTGEEEAVAKTVQEQKNLVYMGTTVVSGRGVMEVSQIGQDTAIGQIGQSLSGIKKEKTPIQLKLNDFSKTLSWIILAVCLVVFAVSLFYRGEVWETFRFAVILAVAAIPEGLPIAITVILALGMRRILKRQGLVKRLISIETLGSTSVICTDKTGTLTEGNMRVVKTSFQDKDRALLGLALVNNQQTNLEIAVWHYLQKEPGFNLKGVLDSARRISEEPFDSEKKYALTVNRIAGESMAFVLGAPEVVRRFCHISVSEQEEISRTTASWADQGLKIVGLARKSGGSLSNSRDFSWLGLVGIQDPLRKEVKEAIRVVESAGIKVKIVTGDFRLTAERIALNLGFKLGAGSVLEGRELETISEAELKKRIGGIVLFTRVTPRQKQKIVKALQDTGEIVAMTGDGVNDAPALKRADIGIAVGSASEVAKEAADLILLDSNFKTIVSAVEEGRLIFSNIRKVVAYVLSNSFVEIFLIFGSMLFGLPYPLTIIQILWLHLICDGPPDIVLGFEPKENGLMRERPKNIKQESILSNSIKFLIFGISFIVGALCLLFFWYFLKDDGDLGLARTVIFATVAVVDLVYIFSFKNLKKPLFKTERFFKNKLLFLGVLYGLVLTFSAIYLPSLNRVLGTQPLEPRHWLMIGSVALATTFWTEVVKFLYLRKKR